MKRGTDADRHRPDQGTSEQDRRSADRRCLTDTAVRVTAYPVLVDGDDVVVEYAEDC